MTLELLFILSLLNLGNSLVRLGGLIVLYNKANLLFFKEEGVGTIGLGALIGELIEKSLRGS